MAYADAATLKQYLGATSSDDDALLTALIARAQKAIDNYCRRTFEASTDSTKYLDGVYPYVNGRYLYLSEVGDICAITSITNGNSTSVASTAYVTEPRNIIANSEPIRAIKLKDNSTVFWTWTGTPEAALTVTGKWAYSVTAPADIVHATIRLAAYYYHQKDAGVYDVTAAPELGQIIVPQGMPRDVERVLQPYRRLV